jgi:hypothetical protein
MNQQEILYNNKLLAHFMGGKYWPRSWNPFKKYHNRYQFPGFRVGIPPNELKFHKDWNWLMWVVEKIEQEEPELRIIIEDHKCIMSHDKYKIEKIARTRFLALYSSVVAYLKLKDEQRRDEEIKQAAVYIESGN